MAEQKPGVYPGVSYDEYATWDAMNHSSLIHFRETPAHARHAITHQRTSKSLQFGWALHLALLEPSRFELEVASVPEGTERKTKAGKLAWSAFEAKHKGKVLLTPDEREAINGIRESVSRHETARMLLNGQGANEVSLVWDWEGLRLKARIDRVTSLEGWPVILDLKSCEHADRFNFERAAHRFGYWEQASMYVDGLDVLRPMPDGGHYRRFMWLACESEPPFCVQVWEADQEPLQWGRDRYQRYAKTWAECKRTGNWPGYPEGVDLLGLPGWVYKTISSE
jgi:exodeoxyribonuclease VIII